MKRSKVMVMVFGCICMLLSSAAISRAEDAATIASQATSELQKSRVVNKGEAAAIQSSLKDMADKGASKEELKSVVTDLSRNRVRGDELKQSVDSVKDLVNEGDNTREAGSIVSMAAAQAHQQGLKGKNLAAKVREAVQQRKAQKDEVKRIERERIQKEEQERIKKETQERVQREERERSQKENEEMFQKEARQRVRDQNQERMKKINEGAKK